MNCRSRAANELDALDLFHRRVVQGTRGGAGRGIYRDAVEQ